MLSYCLHKALNFGTDASHDEVGHFLDDFILWGGAEEVVGWNLVVFVNFEGGWVVGGKVLFEELIGAF